MACSERQQLQCDALLEAERYEDAAVQCEMEFEQTGAPAAGAAAAEACSQLDRLDCVSEWARRLRDTEAEAGVLGFEASQREKSGDDEGAIAAYERQLQLHRQAARPALAARSSFALYQLHQRYSRYRPALAAARDMLEDAGRAEDRANIAQAYQAIYTVLWLIGDLGAAEQALAASEETLEPEDSLRRAGLAARKGTIHLSRGRHELARAAFTQSLELAAERLGDDRYRPFFRAIHLNLVEAYLELNRLEDAGQHMATAEAFAEPDGAKPTGLLIHRARLELARGESDAAAATLRQALDGEPANDWKWELEYRLGIAEEARGNLQAAEASYLRSLDTLESMRRDLGFDELKTWLLELRRQPFDALFRLRARQGRHREALEILERAKARTFLDVFIRNTVSAPGQRAQDPAGTAEQQTLSEQLDTAANRAETLLELLPTLARSPVASPRPIEETLERLGRRHALAYLETEGGVWIAAVAGGEVTVRRLEGSRAEISELIDRLISRPGDAGAAARLGRILLPKALMPPPAEVLHIVTDGTLGRLPFAALRWNGRYLVEDHVLTYLPSLSALAAMLDRPRRDPGPAVVLGDPLGDLPAAAREVSAVARHLGVPAKLGSDADRQTFDRAANAELLHLATHTGLSDLGPWLRVADGKVGAASIVGDGVGPERVILAGCASAARPGRGMWGSLGAAFLLAGSETVVAALWSVEDAATRELMLSFYTQEGRIDSARALARAQRAAIGARQAPATWAPFVHFGSAQISAEPETPQ